ncbi:MAG: hypothetical protein AB7P76_04965 [Candidatus Melainabacteria bacterium]
MATNIELNHSAVLEALEPDARQMLESHIQTVFEDLGASLTASIREQMNA